MARSCSRRQWGTDSGCVLSPERVDAVAVVSSRSTKGRRWWWRSSSSYPCNAFCSVTDRVE